MLDPVSVSFAPEFDPNRGTRSLARRVNADDLIAIQEGLATLFREVFVMELRDSVSGELLARAVDQRTSRNTVIWTISDGVTNTAEARRAFRSWAAALRQGLDDLAKRAG